jgi:hypothetical protein
VPETNVGYTGKLVATSFVMTVFTAFVALRLATTVEDATTRGGKPVGSVETKPVAVKTPVEGTKLSFEPAVRCPQLPEVLVTKVGKTAAAVIISSVMVVVIALVAVVELPVRLPLKPKALTVPVLGLKVKLGLLVWWGKFPVVPETKVGK